MKSSFFHVVNDNQEIIETSYFDTEQADRGLFFPVLERRCRQAADAG